MDHLRHLKGLSDDATYELLQQLSSGSELEDSDDDTSFDPSAQCDVAESEGSDLEDAPSNEQSRQMTQPNIDLPSTSRIHHDNSEWCCEDEQPTLPVFEEHTGVTAPLDENSSELDCFSIFVDIDMIKKIKSETNRYAASRIDKMKRQSNLKKTSLWHKWGTVTLHELYYFFSIILHMCVVKLPKISDYWSTNLFLQTGFASRLLTRDRFLSILYMLHLNDNATYVSKGVANHDPLHKVRPFFDAFIEKCKFSFAPSQNITIDEGICSFRGRIGFRVYMKNKPNKYGIKLYLLCDSETGYVLNCEIYCGAAGNPDNKIPSLIQRLCSSYLGKGHTLYMDRFYTSPAVFTMLWERNTLAVGTVMKNRKGLPASFKTSKLKKGDDVFLRKEHILAIKWKDTRDVLCLSTKHKATSSTITVRAKGGPVQKSKPDAVLDYNINKTGVDRADQLHSYYPFQRKTMKWWKKVFFHLLIMAVVNAYILFKKKTGKNIRISAFIVELGTQLAEKGGKIFNDSSRPSTSAGRLSARHFPEKVPPTANKINAARYCKVCSDKGKERTGKRVRKESRWYCKECDVGLCMPNCFQEFHTKASYK